MKLFALHLKFHYRCTSNQKSREKTEKGGEKSLKSREKIIALLEKDNRLSAAAIAKKIGITAKAVEKHLARLKANGIIERIGPAKGGCCCVVTQQLLRRDVFFAASRRSKIFPRRGTCNISRGGMLNHVRHNVKFNTSHL